MPTLQGYPVSNQTYPSDKQTNKKLPTSLKINTKQGKRVFVLYMAQGKVLFSITTTFELKFNPVQWCVIQRIREVSYIMAMGCTGMYDIPLCFEAKINGVVSTLLNLEYKIKTKIVFYIEFYFISFTAFGSRTFSGTWIFQHK